MKLIVFSFLLLISTAALAKPTAICSYIYAKKVVPIAEQHSPNDKNRHCTVSCMLTLRCPSADVMMAGVLKEVKDLFGPGNAEVEDLVADAIGVDLALFRIARTDKQCLKKCDLYYAP
jgi:hypothetical protein